MEFDAQCSRECGGKGYGQNRAQGMIPPLQIAFIKREELDVLLFSSGKFFNFFGI